MKKIEYQQLIKQMLPKPRRFTHTLFAFLSGGMIGAVGEIIRILLINFCNLKNTDAVALIIFLVIIIACFLTSFCDFDKLVIKFKAGLIVPISGFAHSIQSCALDYKKDGLITGVGSNFFKLAGSVILYGIISSFIFCMIKVVFCG